MKMNIITRKEQYTRDLITYYLTGISGVTLCILGMIGNLLSILVLSRKSMKSSTFSYLLGLSCCDFMALLFTAILLGSDLNKSETGMDNGVLLHLFPYLNPLACTFQVISIWLTLAFTVDRYIMICHPLRAKTLCLISRARKTIGFLYLAGFAFHIPKFFEYRVEDITFVDLTTSENVTFTACDLTEFGRSHIFKQLYHFWFYVIVVCGIPFIVLSILNLCLIHVVLKSRKQRQQYSNSTQRGKKNDTTVMLICVVLIFVICQMPALVSRSIWAAQVHEKHFNEIPLFALNEIANFMVVLNSAINIIPYYYFSVRYRRVFLNLFCSCLPCAKRRTLGSIHKTFSFTSNIYRGASLKSPRTSLDWPKTSIHERNDLVKNLPKLNSVERFVSARSSVKTKRDVKYIKKIVRTRRKIDMT